jgi:hypothetical protein
MSSSILHIRGGGQGGQPQQQGKKEPEAYKSARAKINTAQGDVNKIKDILKELWGKVNCPAGKTKPSINLNLPSDGKQASANAQTQITTLRNACGGNQTGAKSPSGPSESRGADITLVDISTLKQRLTMLFRTINEDLTKLDSKIAEYKIGNKTLKQRVPDYTPTELVAERERNFTTRFLDLKTKVGNLESEVNQILDFAQKGTPKDGSPYLNEYYRSLLAVQSVLTGSISTDTRSKDYPGAKESNERINQHAKDVLSRLTTLKLDVGMIEGKDAGGKSEKYISFSINFITNTDLRDDAKRNEYLKSAKPYCYFNMETPPKYSVGDKIIHNKLNGVIKTVNQPKPPTSITAKDATAPTYIITLEPSASSAPSASSTPPAPPTSPVKEEELQLQDPTLITGGYNTNEIYRHIEAVNGVACLQIIEHYGDIIMAMDQYKFADDKFAFINDVCKYLFRLPGATLSYEEAIKKGDFKKQLPILATIHQLHYIGTLEKYMDIEASIPKDGVDEEPDVDLEEEATQRVEDANNKLNEEKDKLKLITDELKTIETEIKKYTFPKTLTPTDTIVENELNAAEKNLNDHKKQLETKETEKKAAQAKLDAIDAKLDLSNAASRGEKLSERGPIKDGLDRINSEIVTIISEIETYETTFKNLFKTHITNPIPPNTPAIIALAYFKKYDFYKKQKEGLEKQIGETNVEIAAAEEALGKITADKSKKTTELDTQKSLYKVPKFRGAEQPMFIAKYKYAMNFTLNDKVSINLDEIVKNIYRSTQDSAFGLQTLVKVQELLKAADILPPPGVPEQIAVKLPGTLADSTSTPSAARAEEAELIDIVSNKLKEEQKQLLSTINILGTDFIDAYGSSVKKSFIDSRAAAKKNDPFSYSDINQMVEITKKGLPTSPTMTMPKYIWEKAQQQYEKIKGLMADYERREQESK